jgi:hypothetical protein
VVLCSLHPRDAPVAGERMSNENRRSVKMRTVASFYRREPQSVAP